MDIHASTRYCAVLGHPIQHSASPAMQNAGIGELGLDWCYLAFDVKPEALAAAIRGAKAMKFIGLNLTIPHKLLALDMVDELDPSGRKWGAINTIRFEARDANGSWISLGSLPPGEAEEIRTVGFNTDADAIVRSLREDLSIELDGASVLLLGAGGAGRTAASRIAEAGVKKLFLVNRTASKAVELADQLRARHPELAVSSGYPNAAVDLVLNATSLGLRADDPMPIDTTAFDLSCAHAVYDMIYRPPETKLLLAAKAAGCRTANGLGMLLYQGAAALEIWSGHAAPVEIMRRALEASVYGRRNFPPA